MSRIAHIVTHMGGGVGRALSNIINYEKRNNGDDEHEIIILEEPENTFFIDKCKEMKIKVYIQPKNIEQQLEKVDIVILHWWHHPLMAQFLNTFPTMPMRLILWIHVNGCSYPMLPFEFADRAEAIFFTTKYTFDNPYWTKEQRASILKKAYLVYGMGEQLNNIDKKSLDLTNKKQINIGYVGTVNDSKMHPDFFRYCSAIVEKIPNAHFTIVGGNNEEIAQSMKKANREEILDKVTFIGYTNNVEMYLREFDVFGYLLNPYHYGASENVILEAMSFGVPVIALNQSTERYLLKDMYSGLLVKNEQDYVEAVEYIINNRKEVERITKNAHREIETEFSMKNNVERMREGIKEVSLHQKMIYSFKDIFGEQPSEWFLSCMGEDRLLFEESLLKRDGKMLMNCKAIFREENKSSVNHFWKYFNWDKSLSFWKKNI